MPKPTSLPPRARAFIATVVAAGLFVVAQSIYDVAQRPLLSDWLPLAGLTILTGSFSIKVPSISARFSVSEAFVIAAVILFGPAVATLIVVLDSLVVTSWIRKGPRSSIRAVFNMTAGACSLWLSAQLFEWLRPLVLTGPPLEQLAIPVLLLALSYFAINSSLVAIAISYETSGRAITIWRNNFAWLSLNYLGGASVAILLVTYTQHIDLTALSVIVPLLVIIYLTFRTSLERLNDAHSHLAQVNDLYLSTIETLAMAVDAKDQITHGHIRRVQVYAVELAKRLGVTDAHQIRAIEAAALLHDVGKLAVPEHILNKPGKLSTAEFDVIKRHADIGADLLSSIRFPYPVVPIVRHHHEHWDGTGYPSRIGGTDIPIGARILSVVDCFDALNSDRPYRPQLNTEEAFEILRQRKGTMYDPWVVDTFIRVHPEIAELANTAGQQARTLLVSRAAVREESLQADDLQSRVAERAALSITEDRLNHARSVEDAFAVLDKFIRDTTPADGCALFQHSAEEDVLICSNATAGEYTKLRGYVIHPGERVSGWVWANKRTISDANAAHELIEFPDLKHGRFQTAMSTPVALDFDCPAGVLTAYALTPQAFSANHVYAFEQVAARLAALMARLGRN
jgi:putative nucleotidyltransferase with HDIG domain